MSRYLRSFFARHFPGSDEKTKIARILKDVDRKAKVLEVGCGYGDKIQLLENIGFKGILGIEINPRIVEQAKKRDLNVISVEEFWEKQEDNEFDLIVMSHIIEHFQWRDLIDFLDNYLECLKEGGYLLIITPIFHDLFYRDFDHIKPYYPTGIDMVFGNAGLQVQTYSKNHLVLENIYFRRTQLGLKFYRSLFIQTKFRIPDLLNVVLSIWFRMSFGLIGKTNGWIGLYREVP